MGDYIDKMGMTRPLLCHADIGDLKSCTALINFEHIAGELDNTRYPKTAVEVNDLRAQWIMHSQEPSSEFKLFQCPFVVGYTNGEVPTRATNQNEQCQTRGSRKPVIKGVDETQI